jgi:pyruvate formate lyase activating enzyme
VEARYYSKLPDSKVQCRLCPHECIIGDGRAGFCGVRRNRGGTLLATTYGMAASVAMDPIEKKPLYHFYPGSYILSIGQAGCTFRCQFCQNWQLLDPDIPQRALRPEDAVRLARRENSIGIAYTYNEPYVGFEYVLDTSKLAREAGLKNVLVTNGYYMPEPFAELAPLTDAMNIDLKGIRQEFYRKYSNGDLAPVQRTIETAVARGIHVELTLLLIPGLNDSEEELRDWVDYVAGVDPTMPVHFSRYHPAYKMNIPPTPPASLERAYNIAVKKLQYVYVGNVIGMVGSDTVCPGCGAIVIERVGYQTRVRTLDGNKCGACGRVLKLVV